MLRLNSKRNETLLAIKVAVGFIEGMNRPFLRASTNEEIGARLRLTRLAFTGEDNATAFARRFGWSPQRYRAYEAGLNTMKNDVLAAIEAETGVTIQWLARGETIGSEYGIMAKILELQARENDPSAPPIKRTRTRTVKS